MAAAFRRRRRRRAPRSVALAILFDVLTKLNARGGVHVQQLRGGASDGRQTNYSIIYDAEVICPLLLAWVEEQHDLTGVRVDG
jgi:hypothetical protein